MYVSRDTSRSKLCLRLVAILVCLAAHPGLALGEEYPERPVTIVVGFGVGGSADRMARAMSAQLSQSLGQTGTCDQ